MLKFKTLFLLLFAFISLLIFTTPVLAGGLNVPENIRLEKIECGDSGKAYAFFEWDKVTFATSYRFYSRLPQDKYTSYDEIRENKYKLEFNPQYSFYIAVSAVNYPPTGPNVSGGQISESDLSKEFLLSVKETFDKNEPYCLPSTDSIPIGVPDTSKIENPNESLPISEIFKPTTKEAVENMGTSLIKKDQSEQLEQAQKRVEQLEKEMQVVQQNLTESQKRQASLEQTVNNLVKWIKSFFPFFK